MADITLATKLYYLPRGSFYEVLHHCVKIKSPCGEWKLGCVYKCTDDNQIYSRPYDMFDTTKWMIYV